MKNVTHIFSALNSWTTFSPNLKRLINCDRAGALAGEDELVGAVLVGQLESSCVPVDFEVDTGLYS